MKALLYKDFLVTKKYLRMLLMMDLIFVAVSIFGSSEAPFLTIFPLVMCAPTVTSLLSYDERFHFDRCCDSMPVSRKTQVDEKYLLALGYVAVIFLLCALGVFRRFPAGGERTLLLTAMLAGGLLPVSLLLPVMFRLGTEKGRIFYYVVLGDAGGAAGPLRPVPVSLRPLLPKAGIISTRPRRNPGSLFTIGKVV